MKVLTQNYKTGQLALTEIPVPTIKQGHLLVRTVASAVSIGTEKAMIELAQKSLVGKAIARPDWVAQVTRKIKTCCGYWFGFAGPNYCTSTQSKWMQGNWR